MGRNDFEMSAVWLHADSVAGDPQEQAEMGLLCDLAIRLGDRILTRCESRSGEGRDHVRVSARPLAEWLCGSFWRILHEPGPRPPLPVPFDWRMSHCLAAIGEGWAWPDIRFRADGDAVLIEAFAQTWDEARCQAFRYVEGASARVPKGVMKAGLLKFLGAVADRAEKSGDLEIADQIAHLKGEGGAARHCMLEAMLGHYPGCAPDALMRRFRGLSEKMGMEELAEIACALNPVNGCELSDQLGHLEGLI